MVTMQRVDSSNVHSVGYDPEAHELHVRFHESPGLYVYLGVPPKLFDALLNTRSIGSFLNKEIKPNYKCEKR
jgi:KTSC domain